MKKNKMLKQNTKNTKAKYLFLIIIIVTGFLSGIIFSNILSYNDKKEITEIVSSYFLNLKTGVEINYLSNFFTTLSTNYLYLFIIFILGISIIGLLINPFILYFKGFVVGFSIGIIITVYSFQGIVLGFFYIFPHQLINLIVYLLMSFYGLNLSLKLFKSLFLKQPFNSHEYMRKYLRIFLISMGTLLLTSLYETFLADFVMKLFTFLIK